jgi:hypothetical protein
MKKANKKSRRPTSEDLRILRQLESLESEAAEEEWEVLIRPADLSQARPVSVEERKVNKIILKRIMAALQDDEDHDRKAA